MTDPSDRATIRINADVSELEAAMRDISASAERFGESFSAGMRRAVLSGLDLDESLKSLAMRISNLALEQALRPVDQAFGSLASDLAGALSRSQPRSGNIVFNLPAGEAAGLQKSSGQIAALLGRVLAAGSRGL